MDSEQFITDINRKNERAWKQLYVEFYPALCCYVEKLAGANIGVEDIVQDCIVGLWKSPVCFSNVKTLASWLYKSVYSRTLNLIRDRESARRLLEDYMREVVDEDEAVDLALEEAVIGRLRIVLDELSEQQREIMYMTLDGCRVKEIAGILNVSENTVKMQKKRAYSVVRERWGKMWEVLLVFFFPIGH